MQYLLQILHLSCQGSTSAWLLSPWECSRQKQNGWTLRFCFWGWIMRKMYNKTIIEFGVRMISLIIKTSCLCYLPQPSASADNTGLGFDNSWYHAQSHPVIVWNKLQAVSLRENDEFLAMRWSLPCKNIWFFGIIGLHAASRETNVDLQAKSLNGKDEKWTSKTFTKTGVRRWHRFIFALQYGKP